MTSPGPRVDETTLTPSSSARIVAYDGSSVGNIQYSNLYSPYQIHNLLLNPHFRERQRTLTPNSYVNITDQSFMSDRWYRQVDGTNLQDRYTEGAYDVGSGKLEVFNNSGAARTLVLSQVVPSYMSIMTRGQTLRQQFTASATTSMTLTQRLWEWTGTADASSIKNNVSSYSSGTPTFATTSYTSRINTTAAITTTVTRFGATSSTIGSSTNNLLWLVWVNIPNGATLSIAGAALHFGVMDYPIYPLHNNLQLCQAYGCRFYFTSAAEILGEGPAANTTVAQISIFTPQTLRAQPTFVGTVADWELWDIVDNTTEALSNLTTNNNLYTAGGGRVVLNATASVANLNRGNTCRLRSTGAGKFIFLDSEI